MRQNDEIKLRIDTQTKETWTTAAERSGLSLSAWVRLRCNGTALEASAPEPVRLRKEG